MVNGQMELAGRMIIMNEEILPKRSEIKKQGGNRNEEHHS